jgi:hypothetical protein
MPRPPETRFRRYLMQSIMWIVLLATVGLAAMVDRAKARAMYAALDDPVHFGNISMRLPSGWEPVDDPDHSSLVHLSDDNHARHLWVTVRRPSLMKMFIPGPQARPSMRFTTEKIPMGDVEGTLTIYPRVEDQFELLEAQRLLPSGGTLEIHMESLSINRRSAHPANVDLIKRIAASVEIGPAAP